MNALLACLAILPASTGSVSAKDLNGKKVTLPVAGKPTVLLFVGTECPIANRMLPEIKRIVAQHKGVAYFFVYPDRDLKRQDALRHLKDHEVRVPGILDSDFAVTDFAKATVTPESAVYDPKGRLVYHGRINDLYLEHNVPVGTARKNELRDAIAAVLKGRAVEEKYVAPVGCPIPR